METVIRKRITQAGVLGILLAGFLGAFVVLGPGVYNDSDQYISMHIHREPLYPLFLALMRRLAGEQWLTAMGVIQNILAAGSIWYFSEYISRTFRLRWWGRLIVTGLGVAPYLVTAFFSSLHIFLPNSVMSEGLCMPLFLFFMTACFRICLEQGRKRKTAMGAALLLALILSLTRSQMMLTILLWFVVTAGVIWLDPEVPEAERRAGRFQSLLPGKRQLLCLLAAVGMVVLIFVLRLFAVKSYNLVVHGHFINNTYGAVNTLTNILYAADREDGEGIADDQAREFFYQMYDLAWERQANYRFAGDSWTEQADHLEMWHDTIKYEMIEDVFYQTYDREVTGDYILQNLMADETAEQIMAGIFPSCFSRWLGNYLKMAAYGLIRSILVVHPLMSLMAAVCYLSLPVWMWLVWRRRRCGRVLAVMAVALLAVLANAFAVALTIMCLSRYMIYGFTTFYTGYFLMADAMLRGGKAEAGSTGLKGGEYNDRSHQ